MSFMVKVFLSCPVILLRVHMLREDVEKLIRNSVWGGAEGRGC